MTKKHISRILIVALVVCVLCSLIILPTGCDSGKKAIIILPGIMGSNIVDVKTGDPLWAPLEKGLNMWDLKGVADYLPLLDKPEVKQLLDLDGPKGGFAWLEKMRIDKDGNSVNENSAQVIDDNGVAKFDRSSTYGTLDYYKKIYNYLKTNFGEKYDVRMFEYDWRLDNQKSAEALENFVNDHKYKKVVLVGHSMGGVLASTYIARSPKNAKKVAKFISLGTPFFGAHKALRVAENPLSMIGDKESQNKILNMARGLIDNRQDEKGNKLNKDGDFDKFYGKFLDFVHDLPTIYQLIPYQDMSKAYSQDGSELNGKGIVTVDGKPITDYDEYMTFMKERGWINERCVDNMIKWQQEQYVDGVHASFKVDTVYIVGNDLDTECGVNFAAGEMTDSLISKEGDGTVPLYSATCGLPLTDSRVIEFKGHSHGNLAYDNPVLEEIYKIIAAL